MSRPLLPNSAIAQIRDLQKRMAQLERRGGGGGGGGSGLPSGGVLEDLLVKQSSSPGDANWETISEIGYSSNFNQTVDLTGVQDLFDFLFGVNYFPPTVDTPTTSLGITSFELGTTVATNYTLSCNTTKFSDNITSVIFEFSTDGGSTWTPIGSSTPDNPGGGVETSDLVTADITATISFRVRANDGTTEATSGIFTITAVAVAPVITTFTSSVSTSTPREKTVDVLSPQFNVTVTKHTYNISSVVLKRDGTTIHTYTGLATGGGTDNTFTDTGGLTDNSTYQLVVTPATGSPVTTSIAYTVFHYPVFAGCGVAGLDATGLRSLSSTELTHTTKPTGTRSYFPNNDHMYLAYPQSFGAMTSAIDQNGFQIFSAFFSRTLTLDGVTYLVYEAIVANTPGTVIITWT